MLKNHMSTCKKAHVNMQHLFLMMEREGEKGRESERECAHPFFKCVLLITLLAPGKHTSTYPASSAPDTRCRRALPKPCNVGPDAAAPPPRPRRHPQRTPPATARPGSAHAVAPAAARARPAPHSPGLKSMGSDNHFRREEQPLG